MDYAPARGVVLAARRTRQLVARAARGPQVGDADRPAVAGRNCVGTETPSAPQR